MFRARIIAILSLVFLATGLSVDAQAPLSDEQEFLKQFEQMGVDPAAESPIKHAKKRLTVAIDFPAVGVLLRKRPDSQAFRPMCTVTLIAPDRVLTAAHCVCVNADQNLTLSPAAQCKSGMGPGPGDYRVFFQHAGMVALGDKPTRPGETLSPRDKGIVVHDGWSGAPYDTDTITFVSDLAVLRLAAPVLSIRPAEIASASAGSKTYPKAAAAGFGWNKRKTADEWLGLKFHGIALNVVSCELMYPRNQSTVLGSGVESLCLAVPNFGDDGAKGPICSGDSGGPLFEYTANDDRSFVLVGVTNSIWQRTTGGVLAGQGCSNTVTSVSVFTDLRVASNHAFANSLAAPADEAKVSWNAVFNRDDKFLSPFDTAQRRLRADGLSPSEEVQMAQPSGFAVAVALATIPNEAAPPGFELTLTKPNGTRLVSNGVHGLAFVSVDGMAGTWKMQIKGPANRTYQLARYQTGGGP